MKAQAQKPHQNHSSINDSARCQHRTTKGRCTMLAVDPKRQLCFDHARQALKLRQEADFAKYLVKEASGFQTAAGINHALGDLYVLLAQGLITPRRASVLAHICSLLLRTFPAIDTDEHPKATRDLIPHPEGEHVEPTPADSTSLPCSEKGTLLAQPTQDQTAEADDVTEETELELDLEEDGQEDAEDAEEKEGDEDQEQEEQDEGNEEDDEENLLEDEDDELVKTSKPN